MEINLTLDRPHAKQTAFIDSPAKRKVVVAGRRGGKTRGFSIFAVEQFLRGKRILYAGPIADQTDPFWENCVRYLAPLIEQKKIYKNETKRILAWMKPGAKLTVSDGDATIEEIDELSFSRIRAKTAYDADSLRGDWGDTVILDEYATMKPDVDTVIAPMMLDTNGDLIYGGTPRRRNHFYQKYLQAKSDPSGRRAVWHFTSHDNPYLSTQALDEISLDLTAEMYQQEIMAEFLENEGVVFRNLAACMHAHLKPSFADHPRHRIVAGVDWGKQNDFTTISVGCAECRVELARDRFNQIDYTFQRGRLYALLDAWHVNGVLPERNSIGEPIIEQMLRDGISILNGEDNKPGFMTTATTKPPLIENLALAFERVEWQFQDDPLWTAELEAYERVISPVTGRSQYNAPEGMHDDTVIGRALMVWASGRVHHLAAQPVNPDNRWKKQMLSEPVTSDGSRWKRY